MKRILCPTDFSPNAGKSFEYALKLANSLRAEIDLLYVIPSKYQSIDFESPSLLELVDEEGTDRVLSHMDAYHRKFEKDNQTNVPVSVIVENGKAAAEIIRLSKSYDLIVMGNRGKQTDETRVLGSVAYEVFQRAKCPVLLIPESANFETIDHILFATNLEEDDASVVKGLSMFIDAFASTLSMVHVDTKVKDHVLAYSAIEVDYVSRGHIQSIGGYTINHPNIQEALLEFIHLREVDMLVMKNTSRDLFSRVFGKSLSRDMAGLISKPLLILHE